MVSLEGDINVSYESVLLLILPCLKIAQHVSQVLDLLPAIRVFPLLTHFQHYSKMINSSLTVKGLCSLGTVLVLLL